MVPFFTRAKAIIKASLDSGRFLGKPHFLPACQRFELSFIPGIASIAASDTSGHTGNLGSIRLALALPPLGDRGRNAAGAADVADLLPPWMPSAILAMRATLQKVRDGVRAVGSLGDPEGNMAVSRWSNDVLDKLVGNSGHGSNSNLSDLSHGRSAGLTALCGQLNDLVGAVIAEMRAWTPEDPSSGNGTIGPDDMHGYLQSACRRYET